MTLQIPPQPPLPPESTYSEIELAFIDEQPETAPTNQDSNYGFIRKLTTDQLQLVADDLAVIFRNVFIETALEHLDMWEEMYGLPTNPSGVSVGSRRAAVQARMKKGAFTRSARQSIVESYVQATFGAPVEILTTGIELTAGGIQLFAEGVAGDILYAIFEYVTNFEYQVSISKALTVDIAGLRRELERITPAGITVTITEDYFKSMGATTAMSGGFTKVFP